MDEIIGNITSNQQVDADISPMAEMSADIGIGKGADGRGIDHIEFVSRVGIDATYRIYYTDGTTYDYVVKDGDVTPQLEELTQRAESAAAHADAVKASIPADYSSLSESITEISNLDLMAFSVEWENGDLTGNGVEKDDDTMRRTGFLDNSVIDVKMNGATRLYVYYFNADKGFVMYQGYSEDHTISLSEYANVKYVRFATRPANAEIMQFKTSYPLYDKVNTLHDFTIRLSDNYEKGILAWSTGVIGDYSGGMVHSRTPKFLKVVGGKTLSAKYAIGTLYVYEYDKEKNFIKGYKVTTETPHILQTKTRFIKFEHDNYSFGFDVLLSFVSDTENVEWHYNKRINGNTIPFLYEVFPTYAEDVSENDIDFRANRCYTSGLLMLPPNYTETGEKVPLIYFSHGSADYLWITDKEFSTSYMDYYHYLCDEGYAIFDCFGWTDKYTSAGAQMANPTNMSAIRQGIEWVGRSFNVDINSVFVTGKSLGGLQAINMCYEHGINVKACCPLAPEIDMTSIGFGYDVISRKSFAKDLHFEPVDSPVLEEEGSKSLSAFSTAYKAYAKSNAHKLLGYNPLWRGLSNVDAEELIQYQIDGQDGRWEDNKGLPNKIKTMTRFCNVPTKIICAIDDNAVSHDLCKAYLQSLKNGGCIGEMRSLPANTGKHHAVDNDTNAPKVASIVTRCGITHTNVPLAYAEMVQFFRRFS